MVALIDVLLRFYHTAHADLVFTKVDVNAMVQGILGQLGQETHGREIVWKLPDLPVVSADLALLLK
jgi:hypothetical protein